MTAGLRSRRAAATAALAAWVALVAAGCAGEDPATAGPSGDAATAEPPGDPGLATPSLAATDPEAYADELFARTNRVRADGGLPELLASSCAEAAAADRAADLAGGQPLEHAPLDPVLAECAPSTRAAENLSRAAAAPADVVEAWMGSPGHRANVLGEFVTQLGVGCVPDDAAMLCSQVYLGP